MSLADFTARFTGRVPPNKSGTTAALAALVPAPILRTFKQFEALKMNIESKVAIERTTLATLEREYQLAAAEAEETGETAKVTRLQGKVAKQREVVERLEAARIGAQQKIDESERDAAAEREKQAVADITALLDDLRRSAKEIDDAIKAFADARDRLRDALTRLKFQGVDHGLGKLSTRAIMELSFLTGGAAGAYPPSWLDKDIGLAKEIPTTEALLAARERDRASKRAH